MTKDIVVLGAGMVGVCTALALRQRGHAVVLVDRREPGRETSYGNAGIIQREAVQPYAFPREWMAMLRVVARQGNDVHYHPGALASLLPTLARYWRESAHDRYASTVTAYSALIRHCLAEHERLIALAGADDLVRKSGWLQAYRSAAAFDDAARAATVVGQQHGLDYQVLDQAGITATDPAWRGALAGAIHWRDPWTVADPGELVSRYAALYTQAGGIVRRGDATTLKQTGSGWTVATDEGPVNAAHAVIALGPWASALIRPLGYRFPLFVKRGYHRHYAAESMPSLPLLDVENGFLLAPMKRGLRLTTGAEFAHHDAAPTPVQLHKAERHARELVGIGEPVEEAPWLGARPCVADMLPIVGQAPRHRGLWFNFGHGHQGFTLGPVTARLLGELIDGEQPWVDARPYDPVRFG
ncbi:NAD(P)/FAD-dependent oxidoreductase [Cupriavidus consociatus]|uniref:NAD(P)/FAD-dependent oxidoreductase n=1 Tax=Cupriavidus consociatus TaxID=2821357 RepID=UPI001AE9BD74|nr:MULTISPECIES: FAD-binding oxidoreductase [unclassified Cupriavidus]MBP0618533.1 FAD-binding oxidoreductase [Cupriavidus sp. LEh25]MDK2655169.1 FAD-binding oxidoreductase [Cupriavidus sp. LEh21]